MVLPEESMHSNCMVAPRAVAPESRLPGPPALPAAMPTKQSQICGVQKSVMPDDAMLSISTSGRTAPACGPESRLPGSPALPAALPITGSLVWGVPKVVLPEECMLSDSTVGRTAPACGPESHLPGLLAPSAANQVEQQGDGRKPDQKVGACRGYNTC